ncbi:hypothetical protein SAMN05421823_1155 [Catalinimonas alkaloidigena]|uniref:Uncharacterized protein n=1 Tax=Catalinimonas alkaloidigena TaxID=1075417 RepID=A0A1G9TVH3_9BACT|nr:hypothetical protein [Catalinimonas alkaloidigena]SDM51683.1 hypothetical protein SAMN05421823_1155 [Catalinimonas alkaloidigena]
MYTAHIGRRLLTLYNEHRREGPPLTPRQFFDDVFFPLVFNHERYLMLANNSKFDQAAKQQKKRPLTEEVRREALLLFHTDVARLDEPQGHLYLGGSARGVEAATSSQITSVCIPVDADEIYLTWMGAAAGVGVKGGMSMLIDHDAVLLALLEGWKQYRSKMEALPTLKPYQIDTWNGWWLIHRFDEEFDETDPLRDFPLGASGEPVAKDGKHAYSTPPWIRVVFALTSLPDARDLISYVYSFGQTNTTVGFIPLKLPEVGRLPLLYERLFGAHQGRDRRSLKRLYDTELGFTTACQQGAIGLRAIEPKDLRKHMPSRFNGITLPKHPKKESDQITHDIYITWIIAMLNNNEDLLKQTEQTAEALHQFTQQAKRGKQTHKTMVEEALKANGRRQFVEALTPILEEEDGTHKELFNRLVHEVVTMPESNVPLFLTLLRFKFVYVSK